MPTYDYQCRSCGTRIEVIHAMTDPGPEICETCGGALRRVLYPTGIIFKGSGFYSTDSRSSQSTAKAGADGASASGKPDKKTGSSESGAKTASDSGGGSTGSDD
jgi:putative FmdB family regulatory protein